MKTNTFEEIIREVVSKTLKEELNKLPSKKTEKTRLPKYLTRSQVAEILGIHPNTVSLWEKSGKIKRDKQKGLECYLTTKILQILENRRDLGY